MHPAALLFDLDGTLVDTERETGAAMARVLEAELGVTVSQEDRDAVIGHSWVHIHETLKARHARYVWTQAQLIAGVARERAALFDEQGVEPLPGVLELFSRTTGLAKAVVTGSSRAEAEHVLAAIGLRNSLRAVFAAEDVATSKPAPDGYLAACQQLGVAPSGCIVFEDSTAGIAAGLAAGALVVGIRHSNFSGQDQSAAHRIVDSLLDVSDAFLADLVSSPLSR